MAFLFAKSPERLVKDADTEIIAVIEAKSEEKKALREKCSATLAGIAEMLWGKDVEGTTKEPDSKAARQMAELLLSGPMHKLINNIRELDFEGKKLLSRIFEYTLRHHRDIVEAFVLSHPDVLASFVRGYGDADGVVAMCFDSCFRACVRNDRLAEEIFKQQNLVDPFFKYAELPNFEILSKALSSFRLLLTEHKPLAATYLYKHYDKFFENFHRLLTCKNYVTRCEAFKLLGDILVIRANYDIMVRYINDPENLKLAMMSLRGPSVTVALQSDIFHVLKLFMANPDKSDGVLAILSMNKHGLIDFITKLETSDEKVQRDRPAVLAELNKLPDVEGASPRLPQRSSPASSTASVAVATSPVSAPAPSSATPSPLAASALLSSAGHTPTATPSATPSATPTATAGATTASSHPATPTGS